MSSFNVSAYRSRVASFLGVAESVVKVSTSATSVFITTVVTFVNEFDAITAESRIAALTSEVSSGDEAGSGSTTPSSELGSQVVYVNSPTRVSFLHPMPLSPP